MSGLIALSYLAGVALASSDRPVCGFEVTAIGGSTLDAQGFDLSYVFDIREGDTAGSDFAARIELLVNGALIDVPIRSVVVNTAWDDNSTVWCVGTARRPLLEDGDELDISFSLDLGGVPSSSYIKTFSCVFYHEIIVPTFVSVAERHPYITATITLGSILGFICLMTAGCVWWRQRSAYYARENQAKAKFRKSQAMNPPSGANMITNYEEDEKGPDIAALSGYVATAHGGNKTKRSPPPPPKKQQKADGRERDRTVSFSAAVTVDDDNDEDDEADTATLNRQIDSALQSPQHPPTQGVSLSAV